MATRLLVCLCGVFLLLCVGTAFGEGRYQRTKDGKTIVWNDNPKPGDTATWAGDRDAEGYATKTGTLSWYTASGALYARFAGNMVRGKFDGTVTGYSKGRTGHAAFSDGQRTSRWAAGAASAVSLTPAAPVRPPEKIVKTTQVPHPASSSEQGKQGSITLVKTPGARAVAGKTARSLPATASPEFRHDPLPNNELMGVPSGNPKVAVSNSARPPAPPAAAPGIVSKAEIAEERGDNGKQETPEIAVERKQAKPAPPEPPAEGPQLVPAPAALQAPSSSSGERAPTSDTQRFAEDEDRPPAGSPLPSDDQVLPNVSATSGKKSDVDVSVPTVVQPPPASRHVIHDRPAASQANPHLTIEEVIRIANTEARRRGYNRIDYEREEPLFHPDHKTWSVVYEQSASDGTAGVPKPFTVIVDDRTKGAMLVRRQ